MQFESPVLLIMDMQNDFCSRQGVFARNGFSVDGIEAIIPNIKRVMEAAAKARIPMVNTKLTILTDLDGQPMGMGHLAKARPFLVKEGFRDGSWGQKQIDALPPVNYEVRKWGFSAMYQTELEKVISSLKCKTLICAGISTNGVVESTIREAVMRNWDIVTLSDCTAGYLQKLHEASMTNLGAIGKLMTSAEFVSAVASKA